MPENDKDYPKYNIQTKEPYGLTLYSMNNNEAKVYWPHTSPAHPALPNYSEGYLSDTQYKSALDKLALLLYAGYPNNAKNMYEIVGSVEEIGSPVLPNVFNYFLVPTDEIKTAFPQFDPSESDIGAITYGRFVSNDLKQQQLINDFIDEIVRADAEGQESINGIRISELQQTSFYKAVSCLRWYKEFGFSDPLVLCGYQYGADFRVTEKQAKDATQKVAWYLMKEANVENNDSTTEPKTPLEKRLYDFATTADYAAYFSNEPNNEGIKAETTYIYGFDKTTNEDLYAPCVFSYDKDMGKWVSNRNVIHVPANYPDVFEAVLPEGISLLETTTGKVIAGVPYHLVSDTKPDENKTVTFKATAKWLKDFRQYSPIGNDKFMHMAGAIVDQKEISASVDVHVQETGSLTVSKIVSGDAASTEVEDEFTVYAAFPDGDPVMGQYGGMLFDDIYEDETGGQAFGVAKFKLKHGESITADLLPANISYKVVEKNSEGYTVKVNGKNSTESNGLIEKDIESKVEFENIKIQKKGNLEVTETVLGAEADTDKDFNFKITLDDPTVNGIYGDVEFTDGEASFTLKSNENKIAENLPAGIMYKVEQVNDGQEEYMTDVTGESGLIPDSEKVTAAFKNVKSKNNVILPAEEDGTPYGETDTQQQQVDEIEVIDTEDTLEVTEVYDLPELASAVPASDNRVNGNVKSEDNSLSPKTGDNSRMTLWIILALISAGVVSVVLISLKRKNSKSL